MEFLLPIFIKLFPSMLPSTFQESNKEVSFLVAGYRYLGRKNQETGENESGNG